MSTAPPENGRFPGQAVSASTLQYALSAEDKGKGIVHAFG